MNNHQLDDMTDSCTLTTWSLFDRELKKNSLSLICINMRSLANKFTELEMRVTSTKNRATFIICTETWLDPEKDYMLELDGYKSLCLHRNRQGGGIKIYFLDYIGAIIIDELSSIRASHESLFLKMNIPGFGNLIVGGIYRPPSSSIRGFLSEFNDTLNLIASKRAIFGGDMNVDLMRLGSMSDISDYVDLIYSYGFHNQINIPTYASPSTNTGSSCLDHIFHNLTTESDSFVIEPPLSDHYAISIVFNSKVDSAPVLTKFRDFSDLNRGKYQEKALEAFSAFSPPMHDVDLYASYLDSFLRSILNRYFPVKSKLLTQKRTRSPWIRGRILACIRKKHEWYHLAKRGRITFQSYKEIAAKVQKILNLAKTEYYQHMFDLFGNDMKKNFDLLNKMMKKDKKKPCTSFVLDGVHEANPSRIADAFNDYFIDHPKMIHDSIPISNESYFHLINNPINNFNFAHTTPDEISRKLLTMKKNSNIEDIPTKFLAMSQQYLSMPLCVLFNLCIDHGKFPSLFRVAKVIPVHKKGPETDIKNYRPISILCNLSKIFESLLYDRLRNHFTANNLLSENQFGFRARRNTEMACFSLVDRVLPALQKKSYAIIIFLDFKACFDTLSREILFEKLDLYGVENNSLQVIKSYFSRRKQFVNFMGTQSNTLAQNLGVIQGSKNGPVFFDIYSSDFTNLCNPKENIHFADDTCLIYVHDNIDELVDHVNARLEVVVDWCKFNKLSLNPAKSEYMLITTKPIANQPQLMIENEPIALKKCVKYLGLNIDDSLCFSDHVNKLKLKLSRLSGIAYRLSSSLNRKASFNFYYSCVYSALTYCISVYGGALSSSRGELLFNVQKRIVKTLFTKYNPDECPFKVNKLLKLADVHRFCVSIHMYKIIQLGENEWIGDTLDYTNANHEYNTRNSDQLRPLFPRINVVKKSYKFQFVDIWNSVPVIIRNSPSLRIFKRKLSQNIIDMY